MKFMNYTLLIHKDVHFKLTSRVVDNLKCNQNNIIKILINESSPTKKKV